MSGAWSALLALGLYSRKDNWPGTTQFLQVPFLEDWRWASEGEVLALKWHP